MLNIATLIGRLTRDPELRYTQSGLAVVRFTLAVDRRLSKEKRAEAEANNQQTADFINCIAWNKTAETIANYLQKGRRIAISGRIQTGSYEKEGHTVYTTDILVASIEFLETRSNQNNQGFTNTSNQNFNSQNNNSNIENEEFYPIENDDIPF